MPPEQAASQSMLWLGFALLTVSMWGLYGIFLHSGQLAMGDPVNGRYKAFLFVGIAYFLIAVLAPLILLLVKGATWDLPAKGVTRSLIAGTVGAIGAFGVLLAFGAKGTPAAVMSIIFAGAPILNAGVAITLHPPKGGFAAIPWPFFLGILLAAAGGCLVTLFKPPPGHAAPAPGHSMATPTGADEAGQAMAATGRSVLDLGDAGDVLVLDDSAMATLGEFDVVQAGSIPAKSGRLWQALENAAARVAWDGQLVVTVYDDRGLGAKLRRITERIELARPDAVDRFLGPRGFRREEGRDAETADGGRRLVYRRAAVASIETGPLGRPL